LPLPSRSRPRHALVGSAVAVGGRDEFKSGYAERRKMEWQERALKVIDLVPELDYVSRFHARMLEQLRLYPARRDENGELKEIESGTEVDILNRVKGPGGGFSEILYDYGRLGFITGEGNLFGYDLETDYETWCYVWNDELEVERGPDDTIKRIIWSPAGSGVGKREFNAQQAVVYKFWTSHPRRSGEATSPMRAIVEGNIAEELIALTQSVRATAVSRSTRGILIIPQEISPPPADIEGDEDPQSSPWIIHIAEHMEAQVEQAGSAAAANPYLMEVAYEYADRIRLLELHNPQHDYLESALRAECINRIAMGVDFPKEALTGLGQSNHWAAMQILMDMWRSHGAPKAQEFCDDFTSAYYQPALEEAEVADWREIVITYDSSKITVKPDRSDDAKTALSLGAIGPKGFRAMLDIPEEFAPQPGEKLPQTAQPKDPEAQPNVTGTPEDGPVAPGPEGDSGRRSRASASNGRVIELALMRCRELAGIRIRQTTRKRYPDRLEFIASIPDGDIAAVLGAETAEELGFDAIALVSGGADNLRAMLKVWGFSREQADIFGKQVELHAAETLYTLDWPDVGALADRLELAA
jgi:hypothetical protein